MALLKLLFRLAFVNCEHMDEYFSLFTRRSFSGYAQLFQGLSYVNTRLENPVQGERREGKE
jgi:hypothetical protein